MYTFCKLLCSGSGIKKKLAIVTPMPSVKMPLGPKPEITRFKGLGEISPNEFVHFIGKDIRLEPVRLSKGDSIDEVLSYYMGKNTPERQDFIIDNLYIEKDELR